MILDQPYRGSNPWGHRSRPETQTQLNRGHPFPPKSVHPQSEVIDRTNHPEGQRIQMGISPRRIPRVTASVRVEAPSLSRIELMWNLTVCSEMPRRVPISLLASPSANILSTSVSREVISSDTSSSPSSGRSR